jgi:integrase
VVRGKGEGSLAFDESRGLWVGRIELPAHGKERRRRVVKGKDKNDVMRRMEQLRQQLHAAGDLPTSSLTVGQWSAYWMREIAVKTRRPRTVNSYRSIIKIVNDVIGGTRLDKVTAVTVRKVISQMDSDKRAPTYQRNVHSVMSAMFADAERERRIARNPVDLIPAPLKGIPELEVLTPEEATKLVASFRESPEAFMWATFLLTGARRGEIVGLELDRVTDVLDLSWQMQRLTWSHGCGDAPEPKKPWPCGYKRAASCPDRHLVVPADYEYRPVSGGLYLTRPKSRSGWRVIPLVDPLRSILERWTASAPPNPHGLVFTTGGEPIDPDDATRAWPEVLRAAGIDKHVRLHDLRHTAVDLLYLAGVPEDLIQEIVGHSTRAMSRAYRSKGNRERLTAAMLQFSAALGYEQPALTLPDRGPIAR